MDGGKGGGGGGCDRQHENTGVAKKEGEGGLAVQKRGKGGGTRDHRQAQLKVRGSVELPYSREERVEVLSVGMCDRKTMTQCLARKKKGEQATDRGFMKGRKKGQKRGGVIVMQVMERKGKGASPPYLRSCRVGRS